MLPSSHSFEDISSFFVMVNNSTVNAKKKEQLIDRDIVCNERMVNNSTVNAKKEGTIN